MSMMSIVLFFFFHGDDDAKNMNLHLHSLKKKIEVTVHC